MSISSWQVFPEGPQATGGEYGIESHSPTATRLQTPEPSHFPASKTWLGEGTARAAPPEGVGPAEAAADAGWEGLAAPGEGVRLPLHPPRRTGMSAREPSRRNRRLRSGGRCMRSSRHAEETPSKRAGRGRPARALAEPPQVSEVCDIYHVTPARWRSKDGLESDPILAGPVPLPPHPGQGREVDSRSRAPAG
jgi:hypothetical protein